MQDKLNLLPLDPIDRPSVADQVFEKLHEQIIALALPPGARISEVEVSKVLGTSRQPVRDAFFRLSKLGFLEIRPQRATTVSLISTRRVMEARFVRTALEVEVVRVACDSATDEHLAALRQNLESQARAAEANDIPTFHRLDDEFHGIIGAASGYPFASQIIRESKSHLDRARVLSLSFNQGGTLSEHRGILGALERRNADEAAELMRLHLSRLVKEISRIRAENPDYFADEDGTG